MLQKREQAPKWGSNEEEEEKSVYYRVRGALPPEGQG
jgi:hypothetical protein